MGRKTNKQKAAEAEMKKAAEEQAEEQQTEEQPAKEQKPTKCGECSLGSVINHFSRERVKCPLRPFLQRPEWPACIDAKK